LSNLNFLAILNESSKREYLTWLIKNLSDKTRELAHKLLQFLHDLISMSDVNNSNMDHLTALFGPILLRPLEIQFYMMKDDIAVIDITKVLIENVEFIFEVRKDRFY
jgi:hypothetical protein